MGRAQLEIKSIGHLLELEEPTKLAVNTFAVPDSEGVEVQYHGNVIAKFYHDGREWISSCGWDTVTTTSRLDQLVWANHCGWHVARRNWDSVLLHDGKKVCSVSGGVWLNEVIAGDNLSAAA